MSDRLTAWVRTVVPALWSALVAWLISRGLPPAVTDAVAGLVDVLVVPAVLAIVYAGLRWIEPRLPDWLTRVLLGSVRTPNYDPQPTTSESVAAHLDMIAELGRSAESYARTIRSASP